MLLTTLATTYYQGHFITPIRSSITQLVENTSDHFSQPVQPRNLRTRTAQRRNNNNKQQSCFSSAPPVSPFLQHAPEQQHRSASPNPSPHSHASSPAAITGPANTIKKRILKARATTRNIQDLLHHRQEARVAAAAARSLTTRASRAAQRAAAAVKEHSLKS